MMLCLLVRLFMRVVLMLSSVGLFDIYIEFLVGGIRLVWVMMKVRLVF